jgi:hypothetical protein
VIQKLINTFRVIFQNYRSFARVFNAFNAFLSPYFSDILDLQRSPTTRKDEEEAGVVENVENYMEDSEDEVLVLEDTTGGQDSERAEVIMYLTLSRLSRVAYPDPGYFLTREAIYLWPLFVSKTHLYLFYLRR